MCNFGALRKYLTPILVLSIMLTIGCRGCRERDNSFPQAGEVPTAPSVTAAYPEGGDVDIPLNSKISATFNTPMVATEIGTTTFTLAQTGGATVAGTVTYVGLIALFLPAADLAANTSYTATVNAGIRSETGSTLAENFTWTFTTGAVLDKIAPSVVSTNPISGAIGVPVNTIITVPFDEVMDPLTINGTTFFLTEAPLASIRAQDASLAMSVPGGFVSGTVSYLCRTAYFKPSSPLKLGTTYTAVITTGAKDVAGNALAENYVWSFTGVVADTTAPAVASTDPAANKTGVAINTKIAVTFSEMMSSATLTNASFKIEGVSGTVTYDPLTKIATFKPTTSLAAAKLYTATITTAAEDLAGNAITANYLWSFTTGTTADTTAPAVIATIPVADGSNVIPDQKISATFSEGMDSSTINGTTFVVKGPGDAAVAGTVTYAGTTATFITTGVLANSAVYTATIGSGAKDLAGNAMAAAKTWSFTTGAAATTVTSTDPLNGAISVATNKSISATFSGVMDPATINGTTFTLTTGGAPVTGAISYVGTTATFKPAAVLANSNIYTATITTGAEDLAGNAIAATKSWSFTTGALADIIPPAVVSVDPADAAIDVATNKSVTVDFSESMDPATITGLTFTLKGPGGALVAGNVTYAGMTATFKPTSPLANSTTYFVNITSDVGDLAGNAMAAAKAWSFTTGALADSIAPTVTSLEPADAAVAVATNKSITAHFSETMDSSTINNTTFTLRKLGGALVDGAVTYVGTTATFKPAILLANSTTYVANITVGAKDLAGNAMATAKTWSFVTGAAPDTIAPTVVFVDPLNDATGVATNKSIAANFSESMDSATINNSNFTVRKSAGSLIDGEVTYDATARTATFKPTNLFANSTTYVVNISTMVEDLAGNAMAVAKSWSFTTGEAADTIAPAVVSTDPLNAATGVATNKSIAANFSESIDPATISGLTFTLKDPSGALVAGTVTYVGTTATFKPASLFANSTTYIANITTEVKDLAGNAMAAAKTWSFTTGAAPDIIAPSVSSTDPLNAETGVATNKSIAANFSESMDSATITGSTFTLTGPGGALVAGNVTYAGTTATFKPASLLANSTTYVATITTGVEDLAGNAMATAKSWSFTTGAAPDTIAPTVISTDPLNAETAVATNKSITANFSESMDSSTVNNTIFTVRKLGGSLIDGDVTYNATSRTAIFKPAGLLANSTTYVANITTEIKDLAGNAMAAAKTWSFTTGAAPDTIAPSVSSTDPLNAETGVATNKSIAANFSESMDSATITGSTFTLTGPGGALVAGNVTYAGTTATFKPASLLANSTTYVANISAEVEDLAGNAMAAAKSWSFTTGAAPDTIAPTVVATDPLDAETDVATNKSITASFSESMNSSTVNNTIFTVRKLGGALIDGDVTYNVTAKTATFAPTSLLANSTTYVANITTEVEDLAGNAMAAVKTWSFKTGAAPDTIAPTVISTDPLNNETDVAINKSIAANFSESMDPATISGSSFTLTSPSGTLVAGDATYAGTTATFKPASLLANSSIYTARITTEVKDLAGNAMAAVKSWSFKTGAAPDTIAPTVISTDPLNAETGVATNKSITANFSESMDAATITNTNFTLEKLDGVLIDGTVTYAGTTATFKPASLLAHSTTYVANIKVGVKDLAGNAMAVDKTWNFVTGAAPDIVAPTVTSTDPLDAETGVATNKAVIAFFSEGMKSATINNTTFTVRKLDGAFIDGTVTYDATAKAANFAPTGPLANSTTYLANITTDVEDLAGNAMAAAKSWSFQTIAPADTNAPQVTVVYPGDGAIDIGCKETITATFDEDMDSATILQTTPKVTFTLTGPGLTPVAGVVTYVDKVARFTPDNDLPDSTLFTATIDTQATDLAGNELASPKVWTFTTGQSEPVLGRSSSFALMASTAISGTAGSEINGDVGVSPAALSSITLTAADIKGNTYSGTDQEIMDAIADLKIAYDTAKAKATNVVTVATKDLGGKTFYPGLYKTGDSFDITSGDLTLDARGNANSVFIFQMPTTLTVAVGRRVILINNAKASNIYWQVGSSATLNTTTVFKGNIMANVSITVGGGSNVEGRMLAAAGTGGSGAVTFNTSIITIPAP